MKQTLKNRLLAFLAFSGVSIGVTQIGIAQDGFGIVKPVKPAQHTKTADSQIQPIPIVTPTQDTASPNVRTSQMLSPLKPALQPAKSLAPVKQPVARDNTPLAFAPSQITQASYTGNREEPKQVENGFSANESNQFPTLMDPNEAALPRLAPTQAVPPVVQSNAKQMPPIVAGDFEAMPPVVSGSNQVLNPIDSALAPMPRPEPTPSFSDEDMWRPELDDATNDAEVIAAVPNEDETTGQVVKGANYSTAGIPIRPSASLPVKVQEAPPIVSGEVRATSTFPPIVPQDAGTQNAGALPSASDLPMIVPTEQVSPPEATPLAAPVMSPSVDPNYAPATMSPRQSMPPMSTVMDQSMPVGQGVFSTPMGDAPVIAPTVGGEAGCTSCDQGSVSGCGSCGPGGCYDLNSVTGQFNACGSCANARRYLIAEALYFDRDDGFISNSNFGSLGNFDFNGGWRFTLGSRQDSTRGREISYMGTLPMDQNRQYADPAGIITSRFIPTDGFTTAQTSGFFNATQMSEAKQTSFHSLEFNRVRWGWDVLKTYLGVRYILVDDSYTMYSQSISGDQGFFQQETMNHLIGPHIGAELFYDVGYRLSFSFFSKFGVYANINELDTVMFNNGVQRINNEDRGGTLSTSYEAGLIGHYRLNRQARFRFGYNILYLGEVASVSDNFSRALAPSTGTFANDSDDMFFHGLSIGFEIYR